MKNELNKICVACEVLMISERNEACEFMIKSCLEACSKRKYKDVLIVSGVGFFSQELI